MNSLQLKMYSEIVKRGTSIGAIHDQLLLKMYSALNKRWLRVAIVFSCVASSAAFAQPDLDESGTNSTVNGAFNNITIEPTGVATLNGATTAAGNVVVKGGGVLDLSSFTLGVTGTITIEDGGILLENNITTGFGVSSVNVLRSLTSPVTYRYVSSPVNNPSTGTVMPGSTIYRYSEASRTPGDYSTGWTSYSGTMNKGAGFASYRTSGASPSSAIYGGILNSGDISPLITKTNTDNDNTIDGWNLLGNPYPSMIDVGVFFVDNPVDVDGAVYFWNGVNYTSINSGNIPVGQGFFVHCSVSGTHSVFFHNAQRSRFGSNAQYRVASSPALLELQLTSTKNKDITSIQFNDAATDGYEPHFDAIKLKVATVNELYTLTGTVATSIDMLKSDGLDKTIGLGVNIADINNLSISISNNALQGYDQVLLTDKSTNTTNDLLKGAYGFTSAAGSFDARFTLKLVGAKTTVVTGVTPDERPVVRIVQNGLSINPNGNESAIQVMDMMGRTLYSGIHSTEVFVQVVPSIYVVRIQNKDGILAKKYLVTDH